MCPAVAGRRVEIRRVTTAEFGPIGNSLTAGIVSKNFVSCVILTPASTTIDELEHNGKAYQQVFASQIIKLCKWHS